LILKTSKKIELKIRKLILIFTFYIPWPRAKCKHLLALYWCKLVNLFFLLFKRKNNTVHIKTKVFIFKIKTEQNQNKIKTHKDTANQNQSFAIFLIFVLICFDKRTLGLTVKKLNLSQSKQICFFLTAINRFSTVHDKIDKSYTC